MEQDLRYIQLFHKGKTYMEGKEFAGYDKRLDKFIALKCLRGKTLRFMHYGLYQKQMYFGAF